MKILSQLVMFDEKDSDDLGDLERLQNLLNVLPLDSVVNRLLQVRGKGRHDWPCRAMLNAFIASFVFGHERVTDLLRELSRNKQLRLVCGFEPRRHKQKDGSIKVFYAPTEAAFSRFLDNLRIYCKDELNSTFEDLVQYMYDHLDDFGEVLMVDGKAIASYGTKPAKSSKAGRRGEHDADWCRKTYTVSKPNGEKTSKVFKWFGFRLHLIADARYEMPVAFTVTKASNSEKTETAGLLTRMKKDHPEYLDICQYFLGDKGYDSTPLMTQLMGEHIIPIIDIRNCWKDGDETKQYRDTDLVYNYKGDVWYVDDKGNRTKLIYKGYDKATDSLRYGFKPQAHNRKIFRIKCEEDRRIFTPVARTRYKWKRLYNMRSGIERVNGRIDRDYRFEKHTIRGLGKMTMFVMVSLIIYLATAKARIERGQTEHLGRMYA